MTTVTPRHLRRIPGGPFVARPVDGGLAYGAVQLPVCPSVAAVFRADEPPGCDHGR